MNIIKEETNNIIIEKNSKFITYSFIVYNKDQVKEKIKYLKNLHPKATHHCYAYILENEKNKSDDREPKNTAGLPILNVLEQNNIINTLIVVIRYFGGIELGAGPLTRMYKTSATNILNISKLIEVEKAYSIKLITTYQNQKQLDYLLKDITNVEKEFNKEVIYNFNYPINQIQNIKKFNYEIIKELYIPKK